MSCLFKQISAIQDLIKEWNIFQNCKLIYLYRGTDFSIYDDMLVKSLLIFYFQHSYLCYREVAKKQREWIIKQYFKTGSKSLEENPPPNRRTLQPRLDGTINRPEPPIIWATNQSGNWTTIGIEPLKNWTTNRPQSSNNWTANQISSPSNQTTYEPPNVCKSTKQCPFGHVSIKIKLHVWHQFWFRFATATGVLRTADWPELFLIILSPF